MAQPMLTRKSVPNCEATFLTFSVKVTVLYDSYFELSAIFVEWASNIFFIVFFQNGHWPCQQQFQIISVVQNSHQR